MIWIIAGYFRIEPTVVALNFPEQIFLGASSPIYFCLVFVLVSTERGKYTSSQNDLGQAQE